jgi:hypothetical protein
MTGAIGENGMVAFGRLIIQNWSYLTCSVLPIFQGSAFVLELSIFLVRHAPVLISSSPCAYDSSYSLVLSWTGSIRLFTFYYITGMPVASSTA